MKLRLLLFLPIVLCGCSLFAYQEHQSQSVAKELPAHEKLGTVSFPTSCAPSQQKAFERGVALLHSFWYDKAEQQFKDVIAADPTCAIAYWGEAMSLWHQIWDRPDAATLKRGLALVQQGQKLGAKTPRERDYLDALAVFYQNSGQGELRGEGRGVFAGDGEAAREVSGGPRGDGVLWAVAAGERASAGHDVCQPEEGAGAAECGDGPLVPDNPGVAHYIIHSCDSPQMAADGLVAARKYGQIAPSAPHAAHMPGHIFARLGLWQEDIDANLASIAAAEASGSSGHELHAMDFLNYAYLQVGEDEKARALVEKVESMDVSMGHDMHEYLDMARAGFPATYDIEMRHWKEAAALEPSKGAMPQNAAITYWARAVGSGHLKDATAAKQDLAKYDAMVEAVKKSERRVHGGVHGHGPR